MPKTVKIPSEIYSRVSGYYRPVNQWNKGKQEEFACRTTLRVDSIPAAGPSEAFKEAIS